MRSSLMPMTKHLVRDLAAARKAGYTIMEVTVVVLILAVLTSAVAPLFHTTLVRLRTEQGVKEFLTALQYSQERAVSDGREFRMFFNTQDNSYWIERFVEVDEKDERVFEPFEQFERRQLPEGLSFRRIAAKRDRVTRAQYITLYPSGASDTATIRIERANGRALTIETRGRAGGFRVRDRER